MKRLVSLLLIACTAILLSSCVIVTNETVPEPTYSITLHNELADTARNDIFDWYVKNKSDETFAVSKKPTPVRSGGGTSTLYGLRKGYYYVTFTLDDTTDENNGDTFYQSKDFYLDKNTDCYIREDSREYTYTIRSANNQIKTETRIQKEYQLIDSDGNVISFSKVENN